MHTNIFHTKPSKMYQNWDLGLKINHLAILKPTRWSLTRQAVKSKEAFPLTLAEFRVNTASCQSYNVLKTEGTIKRAKILSVCTGTCIASKIDS
jgi:hypothetical protein